MNNTFKIITISSIQIVKYIFKFINKMEKRLTKTNKMLKPRRKDANQTFNDVAFPKQCHSFYIDKHLVV